MCIKYKASVFQLVHICISEVLLYAEFNVCTRFGSKRIRLCNL